MQDFDLLKLAVTSGNKESAMAILKSNPVAVQEFLVKWPQLSEAFAKLVNDKSDINHILNSD